MSEKKELNIKDLEKVTGGVGDSDLSKGKPLTREMKVAILNYCSTLKAQNYTLPQAVAWFDINYKYGEYGRQQVIAIVKEYWDKSSQVDDHIN